MVVRAWGWQRWSPAALAGARGETSSIMHVDRGLRLRRLLTIGGAEDAREVARGEAVGPHQVILVRCGGILAYMHRGQSEGDRAAQVMSHVPDQGRAWWPVETSADGRACSATTSRAHMHTTPRTNDQYVIVLHHSNVVRVADA